MISPIMRPCTVISASHSEQRAICCVPPLNSITSCQINKNALHPPSQEGRRAFHAALVVPPSFIDASRHQPCRVRTYSSPLSGASGRGLLSQLAISSSNSGFFFTAYRRLGFPPSAHSLAAINNCYSTLLSFCFM